MPANSFDFIIVGRGILGLSTAFQILNKSPQASIAIVSPEALKGGATNAAGAMLGCFGEVTETTFSSKYDQAKFDISYAAKQNWQSWYDLIKNHPHLPQEYREKMRINTGTFVILNNKSGNLDSKNFMAMLQALKTYNEPHEFLKATEIAERIVGYDPVPTHRGDLAVYIPNEEYVDSRSLLAAFNAILSSCNNVTFINDKVTSILSENSKVCGIQTQANDILISGHVILTLGSFSQELLNSFSRAQLIIPKILAGVGYAFSIENTINLQHVIRTNNRAGACGLHAIPRDDQTIYIGASNNVALKPSEYTTLDISNFVQRCAMYQVNRKLAHSQLIKTHIGNRPVTIDTFPIIGEAKSMKGLYFLTGTYRDGFHQSPELSRLLIALIFDNQPILNNLFEPERTPIQTLTRDELINEAVNHTLAATHEREIQLPAASWDDVYKKMYHYLFVELYDKIENKYGVVSLDLLLSIFEKYQHEHK